MPMEPIHRLPFEILSDIFLETLDEWSIIGEGYEVHQNAKFNMQAPWDITHVCRRWNEVALSTPRLWSTVTFLCYTASYDAGGAQSLLIEQLKRSGSSLLDVFLLADEELARTGLRNIWPAPALQLKILFSSSSRWRRFYLNMAFCDLGALQALSPDALQSLEVLDISVLYLESNDESDISTSPLYSLFAKAPRLRYLSGQALFLARCQFSWKAIISYDERHISEEVRDYTNVTRMKNLQFCRLQCFSWDDVGEKPIELPQLSQLSICVEGVTGNIPLLLAHIVAPKLTHLSIANYATELNGGLTHLTTVQHLAIEYTQGAAPETVASPDDELVSLLKSMPNLQSVFIPWGLQMTHTLLYSFREPAFLPTLKSIHTAHRLGEVWDFVDHLPTIRLGVSLECDADIVEYHDKYDFVLHS